MRKTLIAFIFLFIVKQLPAQESYAINEHGTYIVNNGVIKKLPISDDLFFARFWKGYAIFSVEGNLDKGLIIVNIENNSIFISPHPYRLKIIDNYDASNNLVIFMVDHIYRLDPVSLEIIKVEYVGKIYSVDDWDLPDYDTWMFSEQIGDQTAQYRSQNNFSYINITYDSDINSNYCYAFHNRILINIYAITVHTTRY